MVHCWSSSSWACCFLKLCQTSALPQWWRQLIQEPAAFVYQRPSPGLCTCKKWSIVNASDWCSVLGACIGALYGTRPLVTLYMKHMLARQQTDSYSPPPTTSLEQGANDHLELPAVGTWTSSEVETVVYLPSFPPYTFTTAKCESWNPTPSAAYIFKSWHPFHTPPPQKVCLGL